MDKKISEHFHRYDGVPLSGRRAVDRLMRDGKMFRYADGDPEKSAALLMEREFARYVGSKYALGTNSCSSGILLALIACGLAPGDVVLMPAFTFTAVPSAIVNAGGKVVPIECNADYRVDLADLRKKARGARFFVLSYMRGHTSDIDGIRKICRKHHVILIEDAAHALGNRWEGKMLGTFGYAGVYSFQSNKIINAGEGGVVVTDDLEFLVKMAYLSGAYEKLLDRHLLPGNPYIKRHRGQHALFNVRITNTVAEMVRSQLPGLKEKIKKYKRNYAYLAGRLRDVSVRIRLPVELRKEARVPDSIQFSLEGFSPRQMDSFSAYLRKHGLPISAFGADKENARVFWNWHYLKLPALKETRASLMTTCDMRLPAVLTRKDMDYLVGIVSDAVKICERV